MQETFETIGYEKRDGVAEISLNRPEVMNAFNGKMHEEIYAAFEQADADDEVRAVLLRGEGRGFSAGADLGEVVEHGEESGEGPDLGEYLRGTYSRLVTKIVGLRKPVVAVLHGPVYGAGLGIALACDLRVAEEGARFSVAFIKIGLMPDAGITYFLPRMVGLGRALEMSMLGDDLDAAEARRLGLVSRVVPGGSVTEEGRELAERLSKLPTRALAEMKAALHESFDADLPQTLEREAEGQTLCGHTADHREGISAFFDKREPAFTGE
ncbi:enoyl-CoA hydratase/isomerase family protein [Rubrobacter aplysinae]|uniref:enoyl-CoA hydratase/isomerase family protein n=1 Tax=Rubrobacter aplysinae TaxID=909625 RepID=UPI00064BDAF2|nr:enoyl-CoA hydratase-related protein [Rubrobacter aplysinae]